MNRRNFLGVAAALALAARLPARAAQGPPAFAGKWLVPTDLAFEEARRIFNGRLDLRPQVLAQIARVEDIPLVLRWASERRQTVAIRGAGHSYEGYCIGPDITLDTRALRQIGSISENRLEVGSGVLLHQVLDAAESRNLAFPIGSCPTVGVAGYVLGGGLSLLSRHLGMAVDHLTRIELIDARGQARIADRSQNSELFWGLRGGGAGNFGVITKMTLALQPIGPVVLFRRDFAWENLQRVVDGWQEWAYSADSRIGSHLSLRGGANKHVSMTGLFAGSLAEWETLQPRLGDSIEQFDRSCGFAEAMRFLGGKPGKGSSGFWGTSDFITRNLPSRLWGALAQSLESAPVTLLLDCLGGAIDTPAGSTAYIHRAGNRFCMQALVYQTRDFGAIEAERWLRGYREKMTVAGSGFAYQNYPDRVRQKWDAAYYGEALPRLRALRREMDPDNLFYQPTGG